jgi:ADP-ribose pyrophosphatase
MFKAILGKGCGKGNFTDDYVIWPDPGFTNTNLQLVHVDIDLSKPENIDPKPQLEPGEFIETFSVPLKDLYSECKKLESEGFVIDARVGTIAEGIELAKRYSLK